MKGTITSLLALAGAFLAAIPGGLCAQAQVQETRDDGSPWGVASGAEWAGEYPRFNPLLEQAGVRWLRLFPEWQTIEPRHGEFNWTFADKMVASARENHIHILGVLHYLAPWASADGGTRRFPIKNIGYWGDFAAACVNRFKGDIQYWEVYNEFNGSFAVAHDKPKTYAQLVRETSLAAKKADPGAKVGMSCANFDLGFLDAAIKAGAANSFDFIAVHPYENVSALVEGNEQGFLSLGANLRKMLRDNRQNPDMPLWITEMGFKAPVNPDPVKDRLQADILVKSHVLALAGGFDRVFWFEARGPAYGRGTDHGLIRKDWSLRPAYQAYKNMTALLGDSPKYLGWLNIGGGGFGFVFKGKSEPVAVAWSSKSASKRLVLREASKVSDVMGRVSECAAGKTLTLPPSPVFICPAPADLVALARADAPKPFPWAGDFSTVSQVTCVLGATNSNNGIRQTKESTTKVVNQLDHSYRRSNVAAGGEGYYAYFRVDPQFVGFGNRNLEITVVARRSDPAKPTHFDITYESLTGYKSAKQRWELPEGDKWVEQTWKVTDANFVGGWGWNFRTDAGGSPSDFLIKEVRVKKVK